MAPDKIHEVTKIDRWFLCKLRHLVEMERRLAAGKPDRELYRQAKRLGYRIR